MTYFTNTAVNIEGNRKLRTPQIEAYIKIREFFSDPEHREALVILPTGTGKSGLISIAPYGVSQKRVLIITPGLVTKDSIRKTQEVLEDNFWINYDIVFSSKDIPVVSEYTPDISSEHLEQSHIIFSNIQRISGNRKSALINRVPEDFFDFIIVDEAHHAPAQSWRDALKYFSKAKVLHVTGTPYRGDAQEIPGEIIHETPLSEVMRAKYVKWLRKETVNAHELYFTTPDIPNKKLTKEDILEFKDKEWIEKSIALSPECSNDVIEHSILKLNILKEASPKVPHKILAVGCSITHAEDLAKWYEAKGLRVVIIHSEMDDEVKADAFLNIENHNADVVISVNMLMEGYDHKYLSILAIFRPYRSLNAFAQVVGRILRAIPENEITAFEIDNNGIVIFHEEIGLNPMWEKFQSEVDRAKRTINREYTFTDDYYRERENFLAGVASDGAYVSDQDSYLEDVDFNSLFEEKRAEINKKVDEQLEIFRKASLDAGLTLPDDTLKLFKRDLIEQESRKAAGEIDQDLVEKRPHLARKKMREILTAKIKEEASNLLIINGLDEKGQELQPIFSPHLRNLQTTDANDAIIVKFILGKLYRQFGPVKD